MSDVPPLYRRLALPFSVSLLALVAATPALAQSAAANQPSAAQSGEGVTETLLELPDVVVSATRIPTPINEVASSVTVITGDEMERAQQRDLPQALESVPGLNVVQTGGPGGQTAVFMRGASSGQTKIMLDGIDVGDPSSPNGAFNIGNLATTNFSRIEVLRGPQSGLYGSDAIGGAISMTTERGQGPGKATGYLEGGSLGTFNQVAGLTGGLNNDAIGYALNIGHFNSSSIPVTPPDIVPPGQPINDNNADNWTYSGRLDFDVSDTFSVDLVGRYIQTRLDYTSARFNMNNWQSYPAPLQDTTNGKYFIGKAEGQWRALDDKLVSTFGIAATDYKNDNSSPYPANISAYDGDRQTYYVRSNYNFLPGQNLLVGLERYNESMTSGGASGWAPASASTGDTGTYAQLQSALWERLFVAANVRYDDNDDYGGHTTWRLAPALLFPETGTKLKTTYGTGFQAPTLTQLYAPSGGNPNLLPQESTGWDIGFEQSLWKDRVSFGATYFYNDFDNLINSVNVAPQVWENTNIASASARGWETFIALKLIDRLSVRADYTYTDTVGHATDGTFPSACARLTPTTCAPLRRPKDKVSVTVDWQPIDALTLTATLVYLSDWWDIDYVTSSNIEQPGYTIVNVAANYVVNQNVTIFGRLNNLFDEDYQDPNGFLAPGFAAIGGLRLTY